MIMSSTSFLRLIFTYLRNSFMAFSKFSAAYSFDFSKLESLSRKNHEITETLNQVMNNLTFDCNTCNLKAICDEVEGMRELHFKSSMGK